MKTALVLGGAGTIGHQLVKALKKEGYWVRCVDIKVPEYSPTQADELVLADLRQENLVWQVFQNKKHFDEVFQLAALMGGAEFIFTKSADADIIHDSALININVAKVAANSNVGKIFFSSSACAYSQDFQLTTENVSLKESDAWPANPDSIYGIEKLFSEKVYDSYHRNYGLNVRIARFHNIFSIESVYNNNKAKAPAALCRKISEAEDGTFIEVLGDGKQVRTFLSAKECITGIRKLMDSDYTDPINIGSDEEISINDLAKMIIRISGKKLDIRNVESNALGVRGRSSNNDLIEQVLGWKPTEKLEVGITELYHWVDEEVHRYSDITKYVKKRAMETIEEAINHAHQEMLKNPIKW